MQCIVDFLGQYGILKHFVLQLVLVFHMNYERLFIFTSGPMTEDAYQMVKCLM